MDYPGYPTRADASYHTLNNGAISASAEKTDSDVNTEGNRFRFQQPVHNWKNGAGKHPKDSLVVHAQVYALGDMLDMPDLRDLAHRKFRETIECQPWPPSDFMFAALEVIRSTPVNGSVLRVIVSDLCADHMFTENIFSAKPAIHKLGLKSWERILKEDIDFSWQVVIHMARKHHRTMDRVKSELRNLIRATDRATCNYCHKIFVPLLEEEEDANPPLGLALKCKGCKKVFETDIDMISP